MSVITVLPCQLEPKVSQMNLESNPEHAVSLLNYLLGEGAFPVVFTAENSIRPGEKTKHILTRNMDPPEIQSKFNRSQVNKLYQNLLYC